MQAVPLQQSLVLLVLLLQDKKMFYLRAFFTLLEQVQHLQRPGPHKAIRVKNIRRLCCEDNEEKDDLIEEVVRLKV